MGFLKTVFDSVLYAIASLCLIFLFAMVLGLEYVVSGLFTWPGFLVAVFIMLGAIAE